MTTEQVNDKELLNLPESAQIKTEYKGLTEENRIQFRDAYRKFAYFKSQRIQLEQLRKVIRARKMKEAEIRGVKSHQAQIKEAEAHNDYMEVINTLAQVVEQETLAYGEIDLFKIDVEIWRTEQANKRSEMSSYG